MSTGKFFYKIIKKMNYYRSLIMVKHTIFSLWLSLIVMLLVSNGMPSPYVIIWIVIAIIGAIIGAGATNRVVDMDIDKEDTNKNNRVIPIGLINKREGIIFAALGFSIMVLASQMLNELCLILSPVAIALLIFHAYSKRFTWACHIILGIISSAAPVGVSIAITGGISFVCIFLSIANILWVTASDIIYSVKSYDFNIKNGIYSIPTKFGVEKSMQLAACMHIIAIAITIDVLFISHDLGLIYYIGVCLFMSVLYSRNKFSILKTVYCKVNS